MLRADAAPASARPGSATVGATVDRSLRLTEPAARQLLLLRAYETADPAPASWTADDRDWATRVARASLGEHDDAERFVAERTAQAMQRLAPRDPAVRRLLAARVPMAAALLLVLLLALLAGLLVDHIGAGQRINLLAPPIWALLAWNAAVYLWLAATLLTPRGATRGLRRRLSALLRPAAGRGAPLKRFAADWAQATAALDGARAAVLLHAAAAALAAGVIASLYLRGLVLDYRAGWESTFVDGEFVHRVLATLLAPASAVTSIAVPDAAQVGALRLLPGEPARGEAAPWLHLYAATLGLFVVAPRLLLALLAQLRSAWLARHVAIGSDDPWLRRLLAQAPRGRLQVWLQPLAQALPAQVALALRERLTRLFGDGVQLEVAEPLRYGEEDVVARCTPPPGTTLVLLAVDLASTPEPDVHGRWLDAMAAAAPAQRRVLVADADAMAARSAHALERLAERRAAWQRLADAHGAGFATLDDEAALERALRD